MPATPLDTYDTRILAELQADARLTLAELGRRVHLSQPAVAERVRKLEAANVITGYRATVNLAALGYGIRALVRVGRAFTNHLVQAHPLEPGDDDGPHQEGDQQRRDCGTSRTKRYVLKEPEPAEMRQISERDQQIIQH